MTPEELLSQLHDIQAPAAPAWWQIAPVYLLLAGSLLLLAGAAWFFIRRYRSNRLLGLARQALARIADEHERERDDRKLALSLSQWLKQVSLLAYPERGVQGLSGQRWLDFLDQCLGKDVFSMGSGRIFGGAVYASGVELDAAQTLALCERWLAAVKPRLQRRARQRC